MIGRLLIAVLGAAAITIGLFVFMNDVANRFVLKDPTQYFAITDYIRAPDRGRELPDVPVIPDAAPERPEIEVEEDPLALEGLPDAPLMDDVTLPEQTLPELAEQDDTASP